MKITGISVYRTHLPYVDGEYRWGAGNCISVAWTSVVVIGTDAGISGAGEFCPCGENYMEAHSHGVEAAARYFRRPTPGAKRRRSTRRRRH